MDVNSVTVFRNLVKIRIVYNFCSFQHYFLLKDVLISDPITYNGKECFVRYANTKNLVETLGLLPYFAINFFVFWYLTKHSLSCMTYYLHNWNGTKERHTPFHFTSFNFISFLLCDFSRKCLVSWQQTLTWIEISSHDVEEGNESLGSKTIKVAPCLKLWITRTCSNMTNFYQSLLC